MSFQPSDISRRKFMALSGAGAGSAVLALPRRAEPMRGPTIIPVKIGNETVHGLPRTQYGHFIEHVGKAIKGGVWAEGEGTDMFMGGVPP